MKYLLLISFVILHSSFAIAAERPRILFDTDITGDVDDVLALAMCHTLADRGACEFLGVTVSKNNPLTAGLAGGNGGHRRPMSEAVPRDPRLALIADSYAHLLGQPLVDAQDDLADALWRAPRVIVAWHGGRPCVLLRQPAGPAGF